MTEQSTTVTRRRFLATSMMGVVGVSAAPLARGQLDVETYRALGLDEPPDLGGVNAGDFARFLNPPGDKQYHPCAEAYPDPTTPRGDVARHERWSGGRIFGGTERDVWVYVPAQLDSASAPPDLIVFQDGGLYVNPTGPVRAPAVLDSLIHAGDLRPTVGVFVNPGTKRCRRGTPGIPSSAASAASSTTQSPMSTCGSCSTSSSRSSSARSVGPCRRTPPGARAAASRAAASARGPRPGSGPTPSAGS